MTATDRRFLRDVGVEAKGISWLGGRAWVRRRKSWTALGVFEGLTTAYAAWGLSQPRAMLHLTTEPLRASVVVNEWFSGDAPISQELRQGRHVVVVRMPGYHSKSREIRLNHKTAGALEQTADVGMS
jgi:hypothetical protein